MAIKAFLKNKQYYIYILIICFIIQAYYIDLFKLLDEKFIAVGGDLSYELVPIKIAFDGHLLGFTKDLVWPNGYATWAYPTMGLGTTTLAWLIGIFPFELSIFFTYFFTAIIGNLINAISLFWAIKDQFVNKVIPFSISTLLGISSLIFYRFGHMPVIWFYFIIIILGVWFKFNQKKISLFKVFTIILLAGIFSPFWWNLVAIFLALFIITIYLINFRLNIENVKFWAIIIFSTLISYFPTLGLYLRHSDIVGPSGRNPWQSNVFGGRISDLLVSSPFLNQKFNLLEKLNEAVSPEARITQFGLVIGFGVIISLIYLVSSLIRQFNFMPKDLNLIIFTLLSFFILGGLGNLQASILFLVNQISPARSWSRLIIFIGIIGLFIFFKFMEHINLSKMFTSLLVLIFCLFSILDLDSAKKPEFIDEQSTDEFKSINFLETSTNNCPILQMPIDTYPIPQDFLFENGGKFVYNEFIPYLMSENNQWSIGGTQFNKYWINNISVPRNLDSNYLIQLKNQGYCAILFDKDFATWQIGRNAGVNLETGELTNWGNWPGVEISNIQPEYEDERYSVYLLK